MENNTKQYQGSPQQNNLQEQKRLTMQQIFDKVESLQGEGLGVERLEVIKGLYEEVKGKDYRREEALAKLIEYYELELKAAEELFLRSKEIISVYPGAVGRLGFIAANDDQFNDIKYNVAS
jgi:hypothetical protein